MAHFSAIKCCSRLQRNLFLVPVGCMLHRANTHIHGGVTFKHLPAVNRWRAPLQAAAWWEPAPHPSLKLWTRFQNQFLWPSTAAAPHWCLHRDSWTSGAGDNTHKMHFTWFFTKWIFYFWTTVHFLKCDLQVFPFNGVKRMSYNSC